MLSAHLAAANGWQTTFVLVNTGTGSAHLHLALFDDGGSPLPLSLSFPQSGTNSAASSVDQNLAGATLLVEASGPLANPVVIGSAQLTTSGNIGGFVIFRYNPNGQEAVVPMETRNAPAYLLAFDNTGTANAFIEGPSEFLPDLCVHWKSSRHFLERAIHPKGEVTQRRPLFFRDSYHRAPGFAAFRGPAIEPGWLEESSILDVAPTLLGPSRRTAVGLHARP
jgi:hypothetical protein